MATLCMTRPCKTVPTHMELLQSTAVNQHMFWLVLTIGLALVMAALLAARLMEIYQSVKVSVIIRE